mmetsp:Transcript_55357/g.177549  ORF Transcript_55357/g.177549 Transcript_55357/m.177549 type:complete len:426 (+) Transcript_55357:85-1362(+)
MEDLREPLLAGGSDSAGAGAKADAGFFAEGSVATSVVLLCAAAIGTGVLALPYAVSCVGVMPAMVLFALAGAAGYVSNIILFRCVQKTGLGSYGELMTGILGKYGAMVLDTFVWVEGLGAVSTYLVFIMDYVPQVCALAGEGAWCMDRTNVAMAASLIIWPLSCFKGLSALRYTSTCSIATVILTSLVVIAKAPGCFARTGRDFAEAVSEVRINMDGLQVLAMACFAFMAHTNTPEIALRLRSKTRRRFAEVVGLHTGLLWAVYSAIGACGFLSFIGSTHQDFLTNYPVRDAAVLLCRVLLSTTLVFACPINIFPAMQSLFNILEGLRRPQPSGSKPPALYEMDSVRVPVTTCCFAVALGVALRTPRVADLISVISAFFSSPLMFTFPAIMYRHILGCRGLAVPAVLIMLTVALWAAELARLFLS